MNAMILASISGLLEQAQQVNGALDAETTTFVPILKDSRR